MKTKKVVFILNETGKSVLDFYVHHDNICNITERYQLQRLEKVLSKYSKHGRSVRETEDKYNKLSKYQNTADVLVKLRINIMNKTDTYNRSQKKLLLKD